MAGPVVLSAVGFGTVGVAIGSAAAGLMDTYGGAIAKGSFVALCQSAGATGTLGPTTVMLGTATGAVASTAV